MNWSVQNHLLFKIEPQECSFSFSLSLGFFKLKRVKMEHKERKVHTYKLPCAFKRMRCLKKKTLKQNRTFGLSRWMFVTRVASINQSFLSIVQPFLSNVRPFLSIIRDPTSIVWHPTSIVRLDQSLSNFECTAFIGNPSKSKILHPFTWSNTNILHCFIKALLTIINILGYYKSNAYEPLFVPNIFPPKCMFNILFHLRSPNSRFLLAFMYARCYIFSLKWMANVWFE